jgi:hypothetical protein
VYAKSTPDALDALTGGGMSISPSPVVSTGEGFTSYDTFNDTFNDDSLRGDFVNKRGGETPYIDNKD